MEMGWTEKQLRTENTREFLDEILLLIKVKYQKNVRK